MDTSYSPKWRDRKFVAVLYPDDPDHFAAVDQLITQGYNFAAILHDKDVFTEADEKENPEHKAGTIKKPHWHIVMKFKNAVWNTALADQLGIKPNYIKACQNLNGALLYLVHYGFDEKEQYDLEEVFGSLSTKVASLLADDDESTRALNIYDLIRNSPGIVTYTEIFEKACKNGLYSDVRRMGTQLGWLINEHNEPLIEELRRSEQRAAVQDRFRYHLKHPIERPFWKKAAPMGRFVPPEPLNND